jgi:hypothetical protein
MNRKQRIEQLTGALTVFVGDPQDGAFLIAENADRPDDFTQFMFHDGGILYAEVGSHGWGDDDDQLPAEARAALGKLGFTGGGRRRNHRNEGLPHDPHFLANLVEQAFGAAYGPGLRDLVFATTHVPTQEWLRETGTWTRILAVDSSMRTVHVDRGLIKEVLESRGLNLFADPKGDMMTFWGYEPEIGSELKIWFKLEGEDEDVYRVSATGDRPLPRGAWNEATLLCNEWNSEHRWPSASVMTVEKDGQSLGFVELNANIPVKHGASPRMLDDFTGRVVYGMFEFFRWFREKRESATVAPVEAPLNGNANLPATCPSSAWL